MYQFCDSLKSWHWKLRQNQTLSPVCCRGICRGAKPRLFAHSPRLQPNPKTKTQSIWVAKNIEIFKLHFGTNNFGAFYPANLRSILHHRSKNRHFESWEYCGCRFVDLLHPTSPVEGPAIRQDSTGFSRTGASSESKTWMWKCHFFGDLTGTCFHNVHYGISVSERLRQKTKPNSYLWI